jgi:hypothetical protein
MMPSRHLWIAFALTVVAAVPCHAEPASAAVDRLRVTATASAAQVATRLLVARSVKLKKLAWLEAETTYIPGQGMRYRILNEGGDEGIRKRVLRKVLESEAEMSAPASAAQAALTPANYSMTEDASGAVRLTPRRRDVALVDGVARFDPRGSLVSVEGRLAKSPSFWVRSVDVRRTYQSIAGYTLPVHVTSVADVKLAGRCEFSMWIDYRDVDGRAVAHRATRRDPATGRATPLLVALQQQRVW